MSTIKRIFGILWMALGPLAIWFLASTALEQIALKPTLDTKIQWGVFVGVFLPIAFGLMIFGYYAFRGEYEHLPHRSDEL